MYRFFLDSQLITRNQYGFKPGGSYIFQLLLITQEIYNFFGGELQARNVLLDISKAFDKVWDERVIFKLEQNDISGDILNILINKKRIVVFNGQVSTLKVLMQEFHKDLY